MSIHRGQLHTSPFIHTMLYGNKELKLYFYTDEKRIKFIESYKEALNDSNDRIMRIYKYMFHIDLGIFAIVRHYTKIEKRGFYIQYDGTEFKCLDEIMFQLRDLKRQEN